MAKIEPLPSRSVNQYRGRDIFAYLGLRYCVGNGVAQADEWAENNAIQIVIGSNEGAYLRSYHFKQVDSDGKIEHRELFLPSPSEALAEAALIRRCAKFWNSQKSPHVFSYEPSDSGDMKSYFKPYIDGLRRRQESISAECDKFVDGDVIYIDIKKFYPSITPTLARKSWGEFCNESEMEDVYRNLGYKLIYNYSKRTDGSSILTGPMFAHCLANLVLRPIDRWAEQLPVKCLRYVDDMTLIGPKDTVRSAVSELMAKLSEIGLHAHELTSPKTLIVNAKEWKESAGDFKQGQHSLAWMKLIGDIKKLLLFQSDSDINLSTRLTEAGFRLPILDYAVAIQEATAFERVRRLGLWAWLRIKMRKVSIDTVIQDASSLSNILVSESINLLNSKYSENTFQRKRLISKIRYRLGRLIYIGRESDIDRLLENLEDWPELAFHTEILRAIRTKDCYGVAALGTNAAQAAAQIFRTTMETATFSKPILTEQETQSLAVFIMNGVHVEAQVKSPEHPLLRLARGPIDEELMRQPRGMVQEIACLHGRGKVRHPDILGSAFDLEQDITLDALEFDYGYYL